MSADRHPLEPLSAEEVQQAVALLQRAGASEVVFIDDLVAGALIDRLSMESKA